MCQWTCAFWSNAKGFESLLRKETYLIPIGLDLRIRTYIECQGSDVLHFAVTLEYEVAPGDWLPVVRYDTTGGEVHRDRMRADGSKVKHRETVRLGRDWHAAIKEARKDLISRWEWYVSEFKKHSE